MKCVVHGCRKPLDETGFPKEYCDYQQGRCPMQRSNRDAPQWVIVLVGIVTAVVLSIFLR